MQRTISGLAAIAVIVLLTVQAWAAVPQTINYQGYLRNTNGTPVSSQVSVVFSLYTASSDGTAIWTETRDITPENGLYSVELGGTNAIPASVFSNDNLWLGIKVGNDSEMTPREQLTTVPYAFRAAMADSAAGVAAGTQTLQTGGAGNTGLIVKGASGQTANLQEWQGSAGAPVASVSPSGDLTLTGKLNLPQTTGTTGIITSGGTRFIHSYGNQNFFAGVGAGNLSMGGSNNTASGYNALSSNSSGGGNSAFGAYALNKNSGGGGNTAVGHFAMSENTTGHSNTAGGYSSLANNTTGFYNTAIGYFSLRLNADGHDNTAVGGQALASNTTGSVNTAIGVAALQYNTGGGGNVAAGLNSLNTNTTGNNNVAYGNAALFSNTTAGYNSAIGGGALFGNTTGVGNTALGYYAGYTATPANANTTGSNNTFIGYNSGPGIATQLTNATAIGANAQVSQSNSMVLGASGVKVGIGTTTPTEALDVFGNVKISGTLTSASLASSSDFSMGDRNIYLGSDTNHGLGWYGTGKLFSGVNLNGPALFGGSGGALGTTDGGQKITLKWDSSGRVGIGTAAPNEQLELTGNLRLPITTETTGIIKSGTRPLLHTYGGDANLFVGVSAGNLTMSGSSNTALGNAALSGNTGGYDNTATGALALSGNTTGHDNTANGAQALGSNTTGNYNTATGSFALRSNISGNRNTASGYAALFANTIGYGNTATGTEALINNATAGQNTAIGSSALSSQSYNNGGSVWATDNTAVGYEALLSNQPTDTYNGKRNTAVGSHALRSNTTGNFNTATGESALYLNTTGAFNTATGSSALYGNTTGSQNTAIGQSALNQNTTGNYNTALGYTAGDYYPTGSHNTFVGGMTDAAADGLLNATAIGYGAIVDASNHVRIGNSNVTQIGGQVAWSNLSDIRTKKEIEEIGYGLDFINSLRPVQFRMKNGDGRTDFGFIAQEIETLLGTDFSVLGIGGDPDRTLSLRYTDFIAPMVKAMQEQQAMILEQRQMIEQLKTEMAELKRLPGK